MYASIEIYQRLVIIVDFSNENDKILSKDWLLLLSVPVLGEMDT